MAFLSGYTKRKKITIDNTKVDSNLTDFPVRVFLNADSDIGAVSNADGFDIRFTSSDGTTLLKYEREDFAISGGKATGNFFVKVPSVSSSADTEIYIYYRATDTADGADPTNVWDSNFKGRYSMKDLTTSTIEDSTSNDNDGTKTGANQPIQADGKIGKCQDYTGGNYIIDVGDLGDFGSKMASPFTFSCLVKSSITNAIIAPFGFFNGPSGTDDTGFIVRLNCDKNFALSAGKIMVFVRSSDDKTIYGAVESNTGITDGNWHKLDVVVLTASNVIKVYLDGVLKTFSHTNQASPTLFNNLNYNMVLGANNIRGTASNHFNGLLDEVQITQELERSAAYIKATYNSNFGTLLSLGAEEETSEYTATYTPVLLSLVIPAITATAIVAATASFTPVALSQTIPAMTASYEAEYEANYTPLEISQTIPDFTASYIAEIEATYTPLEMSLVIPDITAIGRTKLININKNTGVISNIGKTALGVYLMTDDFKPIFDERDDTYIMTSFGSQLDNNLKRSGVITAISKNTGNLKSISKNTGNLKNINKS